MITLQKGFFMLKLKTVAGANNIYSKNLTHNLNKTENKNAAGKGELS